MTEYADTIDDGLGLADAWTNNWDGGESIPDESLVLADSQAIAWPRSISEDITFGELQALMFGKTLNDLMFLYDTIEPLSRISWFAQADRNSHGLSLYILRYNDFRLPRRAASGH